MVDQYPEMPSGTYIYLIDSHLWSQYEAGERVSIHVDAPEENQGVLLLSEATLHNLVNKTITMDEALYLGLINQT